MALHSQISPYYPETRDSGTTATWQILSKEVLIQIRNQRDNWKKQTFFYKFSPNILNERISEFRTSAKQSLLRRCPTVRSGNSRQPVQFRVERLMCPHCRGYGNVKYTCAYEIYIVHTCTKVMCCRQIQLKLEAWVTSLERVIRQGRCGLLGPNKGECSAPL